jgi:hypothetical protein
MDYKRYLWAGSTNSKGENIIQLLGKSETNTPLFIQRRDIESNTASVNLFPICILSETRDIKIETRNKEASK